MQVFKSGKTKVKEKGNIYIHRILKWLGKTTLHGIPRILESENWLKKLMWSVFFFSSTIYCFVTVIQLFDTFFKYGVTTTITRIKDLPATFPAVTICNINPFNEQYAMQYILNRTAKANCFYLPNSIEFQHCYGTNNTNQAFDTVIDQLKRIAANDPKLTDEYRMYFGYDLAIDMLVSCDYNGITCTASDFTKYWSNEYGNCYTFNQGNLTQSPHKTSVTGNKYGLKLELVTSKFKNSNNNIYSLFLFLFSNLVPIYYIPKFSYKTGIYLMVHNQSTLPFTMPSGVNIKNGFETYVAVNRYFTNKLPTPYSDCLTELTSKNTYGQKLFGYFSDLNVDYYDQNVCFTLCYQDKLIENCSCIDISTPKIGNSSYCATDEQIACLKKFDTFFSTSDINAICESACPEQCNIIEYDLTTTEATFPTFSYAKLLQINDSSYSSFLPFDVSDTSLANFTRMGFLKLVVNYDQLYYTSYDESPLLSPNDLLAALGGQLSLFMGLSILSFAEIFDILVEFIILMFCRKKIHDEEDDTSESEVKEESKEKEKS